MLFENCQQDLYFFLQYLSMRPTASFPQLAPIDFNKVLKLHNDWSKTSETYCLHLVQSEKRGSGLTTAFALFQAYELFFGQGNKFGVVYFNINGEKKALHDKITIFLNYLKIMFPSYVPKNLLVEQGVISNGEGVKVHFHTEVGYTIQQAVQAAGDLDLTNPIVNIVFDNTQVKNIPKFEGLLDTMFGDNLNMFVADDMIEITSGKKATTIKERQQKALTQALINNGKNFGILTF